MNDSNSNSNSIESGIFIYLYCRILFFKHFSHKFYKFSLASLSKFFAILECFYCDEILPLPMAFHHDVWRVRSSTFFYTCCVFLFDIYCPIKRHFIFTFPCRFEFSSCRTIRQQKEKKENKCLCTFRKVIQKFCFLYI